MDIFGEEYGRGSVVVFKGRDGDLNPASIVKIQGFFDGDKDDERFLIDFSAVNSERFALMPCFGKQTHIFAYGHDMGTSRSTCTILCFLGSHHCKPADNAGRVGDVFDYYKKNRLSKTGKDCEFQLFKDNSFAKGYLISMQVKAYNPELNAAAITVTYMTLPPE